MTPARQSNFRRAKGTSGVCTGSWKRYTLNPRLRNVAAVRWENLQSTAVAYNFQLRSAQKYPALQKSTMKGLRHSGCFEAIEKSKLLSPFRVVSCVATYHDSPPTAFFLTVAFEQVGAKSLRQNSGMLAVKVTISPTAALVQAWVSPKEAPSSSLRPARGSHLHPPARLVESSDRSIDYIPHPSVRVIPPDGHTSPHWRPPAIQ